MTDVHFDSDNHTYSIEGLRVRFSVTELVASFFEKFNADIITRKIVSGCKPDSEYWGMTVDDIKIKWEQDRHLGTLMHEKIHKFYLEGEDMRDQDKVGDLFPIFYQYRKDWELIYSEFIIIDKSGSVAGTIDALFRTPDGKIVLVDWKRSKNISFHSPRMGKSICAHLPNCNGIHYSLQLNMYKHILENSYNIKVDDMVLINLHPCHSKVQEIHIPNMGNIISQMISSV